MQPYLDLMRRVLHEGKPRTDRTGVGTMGLFGAQVRYDLRQGFPLVTTKRLHLKSIVLELLWFLRGDTNARWLQERGVRIWNEWADVDGELGPIYGRQWRSWGAGGERRIDQLVQIVEELRSNPSSRRLLVSAWNVGELAEMRLPPCHVLFQFHVQDGALSCQLYQRSGDLFLGVPFNVASYALLTAMVAQVCGLQLGDFIHTLGDVHLYVNHLDQAREQLERAPRPPPQLWLDPAVTDLFSFGPEHIRIDSYDPHPAIRAEVAV